MSRNIAVAHDPSAPAGHLPSFAREETRAQISSTCATPGMLPMTSRRPPAIE
jgi:hypothetical protein